MSWNTVKIDRWGNLESFVPGFLTTNLKNEKEVFYNGAFHANEWITSVLVMKFLENLCKAYALNSSIYNYSARYIYNNVI